MLDILAYTFMQKALIAGVAIGASCSMLGLFLVLRRYSLFGDALSHVALSGIAIGIFLNVYPLWSAMLTSVASSIGITRLRQSTRIQGDALIAVLLITGVASAVLLISASGGFKVDLFSYLFGSITLMSSEDTLMAVVASIAIIAAVMVLKDRLFYMALDERQARISGVNVTLLNYVFMMMASIMVIVAMRLVGILLVSSLIVLPNVAAMMLGRGFRATLLISSCISVASVIAGIITAYYLNVATSGMIVMICVGVMLSIMAARRFKIPIARAV
ncbi:MAG: metal ABC transporter permease [Candidatus Nitrosocaldus sp.]|nr:metal ABC transporter permease [Candidatus Nitrosocaldus sp.]MDW8276271.1 metal ABC transporter permease [Candidatus Nitrosocaldus sp.]